MGSRAIPPRPPPPQRWSTSTRSSRARRRIQRIRRRPPATATVTPLNRRKPVREVDFLPDWYPKVRQRKRVVALQAWITMILVCGLGLWMLLVQRNVQARETELRTLRTDLAQSETELQRLEDLLKLQ